MKGKPYQMRKTESRKPVNTCLWATTKEAWFALGTGAFFGDCDEKRACSLRLRPQGSRLEKSSDGGRHGQCRAPRDPDDSASRAREPGPSEGSFTGATKIERAGVDPQRVPDPEPAGGAAGLVALPPGPAGAAACGRLAPVASYLAGLAMNSCC